ncbi:unnamed protein product [Eruca vesicaria subsp. sativa]|uniref:Mediator complex subunit 15 KIX domain-containing protein n=1 Tax=Eruca vesicaria subsp. sativa TaxID=29727 RepID=A0ABC8KZ88_ERUVS|nr:unnamed protein product [Eruca vesicaria subsp. sativa]
MEGNWNPNEQGRDSLANNWRSTHEPDLRKRVIFAIVEKLKICFPNHSQNDINNTAFKFEDVIYGMATDKSDYLRKISEKILVFDQKFRSVQSGSSVNGPNTTQDPGTAAQALNQGESLPTFLPYTQTPTSQQWFHQNNNHESSGFSTQVPITAAQSLNNQMGEGGVHSNLLLSGSQRQNQGRQQFYSQPQQQPQSYKDMFQCQVNHQQPQPPYTQQQQHHHQQSLLQQPVQQQMTYHTSLANIQQSFPQTSAHSSLTSSGQQNSQFLPRHQFPTQRVHSSHQQQMSVPFQEQKPQEHMQLMSQLINGQDTLQNHLTSQPNNWEQQQGAFTLSSSQQNNIYSFQEMGQQNNNLQDMYQQQHLYSHSNNPSVFPSQQQMYMPSCQSGNFSAGQVVGQSQPMMLQQYQPQHQQPHNRIFQQHLDDTQRFQAAASQDYTGKTGNANGKDWQEETYQKIKSLKDKYLSVLSTLLQKVSNKLQEVDSLPQQKMQHDPFEKLRAGKSTLELLIKFLNVGRDSISESHRNNFGKYEEQVLRFTKNHHQTMTQTSGHNQVHVSQSLDNDQMNISPAQSSMFHQNHFHHLQMQHQTLQRQQQHQIQHQSSPQLVDQQILPTTFHNTGTLSQSPDSPFFAHSPNFGDLEKPISVDSQLYTTAQEQPIDHLRKAFQTDSYKQFCRMESEADSTASSGSKVNKIETGCALLQEIKEINGSLVETMLNICNEDVSGIVVTCSYSPVALSDTLEAHYKSGQVSQIQPLRLLVPVNYPYSPIQILEKVPSDTSLHKYDDLSARARSRFSLSMKEFSEPLSLKEIAQVWDGCARETMAEFAEQHGGSSFSSMYGHWESVLGAS